MSAPVPYATVAMRDVLPNETSKSGLITNTTSNALRALLANPGSVTGAAPSAVSTGSTGAASTKGVANPFGLGLTAYEPNTSPFIHELADAKTGVGSTTLDSFEQDYADATATVDQHMQDEANAAAAKTVNPAGDFASGGVIDASGKVSAFINAALSAASKGVPYVWGGTNLARGVDCSGLIYAAAQAAGITDWKRYVAADYGKMPAVDPGAARPGDIVYWRPGQNGVGPTGHVGIYIGNGQMVVAPQSGETVKVEKVFGSPTFHRIFDDSAFGTVTQPDGSFTFNYNGRANPWASQAAGAVVSSSLLKGLGIQPPSLFSDQARFAAAEHGDTLHAPGPATARYTGAASGLKVNVPYANLFSAAGAKYGVSPALLAAVAHNESSFNPNAHSNAGAVGLMQFMPGTAKGLGVNPLDPASAVDGAARLLVGLYRQFGSWNLALAAYNAGSGNVRKGYIPATTSRYVSAVLNTAAQYGG